MSNKLDITVNFGLQYMTSYILQFIFLSLKFI